MTYEPDTDTVREEDEDVKIWRGDVDGAKRRDSGQSTGNARQSTGKHSRKESAKSKTKKNRKTRAASRMSISAEEKKALIFAAVSALLLIAVGFIPAAGWKKAALYLIPFAAAGYDVLLGTAENILNLKLRERNVAVSLVAVVGFLAGEYAGATAVFIIFKLCEIIEAYAVRREKEALASIRSVSAGRARVETEDGIQTVGPEYINEGDIVVVAPGEQIPVDGIVKEGVSTVEFSPLTGTPANAAVNTGHRVYAGCVNLTAELRICAEKIYEESASCRVAELIENAAENPSPEEIRLDKAQRLFAPAVLTLALATALIPPLAFSGEWKTWICRAAALSALSGAAAPVFSVALAYFGALVSAAKKGILIKGSNITALLSKPDTFVFDKTGTVTEGRYAVTGVFPVNMTEENLLTLAATAEQNSSHAIAAAIKAAGEARKAEVLTAEEMPGKGISVFLDGRQVYVGNAALLEEHGIEYALPSRPGAAVHVALDGKYCGHILLTDKVRKGAFEAIDALRSCGVGNMVMLTGDVLSVARPIANKLNFNLIRAELTPEKKAAAVAYLTDNCPIDRTLIFVGDVDSDAQALKNADIGISMEALGREEAMDNADIAILDGEIKKIPAAVELSRKTSLIAAENIGAALAVKALAAILILTGIMPLLAAAITEGVLYAAEVVNALRTFKDLEIK